MEKILEALRTRFAHKGASNHFVILMIYLDGSGELVVLSDGNITEKNLLSFDDLQDLRSQLSAEE